MNMSTKLMSVAVVVVVLAIACVLSTNNEIEPDNVDGQHPLQGQDLSLVDDDGSVETALINYLFAKKLFRQLENGQDLSRLLHKRNYWKQCAFNAVSCFGRRRK